MTKELSVIGVKTDQKTTQAAFRQQTIDRAANSSTRIELTVGAFYANPLKQVFHGEQNSLGMTSNRVFVFEVDDEAINFMSIPYNMITNLAIGLDGKVELPVKAATRELGPEGGKTTVHRPVVGRYMPCTKGGNLVFKPTADKTNLLANPFVLKCADDVTVVNAVYESNEEFEKSGRAYREVHLNEDGTVEVETRQMYLFSRVTGLSEGEILQKLPQTKKDLEKMFKDAGKLDFYKENVEAYILD